jgi:ABC-2 type transport system ATP-binding protein
MAPTRVNDIVVRELTKTYGDIRAVDRLSLHVPAGIMFGLIGPDGAGKTTTLRILCGLVNADQGTCILGGYDVAKQTREVKKIIGYMPQRFSLYPDLTVAENLRFFADLFYVTKTDHEERLGQLLKFSRLDPFQKRRAAALSGGMKQKLALSCTLVHTPQILLLDEPTTGVDPISRREFWAILDKLRRQGVTIVVTTPYMDEAAECDRVAFMHNGKLLAEDVPQRLTRLFPYRVVKVRCDSLNRAAEVLKKTRGIISVQTFGDHLHVAGKTFGAIRRNVLRELEKAGIRVYSIDDIEPEIEDVFVELMQS